MVVVTVKGTSYSINKNLYKKWLQIKGQKLIKADDDKVFVVDGRERTGKSVFTIQQAAFLDPTIVDDLSRICFNAEEFLTAIRNAKPGQVIIFDEAFRGLSSRAAMSKTNKKIIQAMMEMGQKNLIVFIVLPSFFMLDLYVAMLRSSALFHIAKQKDGTRRYFKVYNYKKKAKLYQHGVKKGWEYTVATKFKGNFHGKYPGGDEFEARYRAKKLASLEEYKVEENKVEEESRFKKQRDALIAIRYWNGSISQKKLAEELTASGTPITEEGIRLICNKYKHLYAKSQVPTPQAI